LNRSEKLAVWLEDRSATFLWESKTPAGLICAYHIQPGAIILIHDMGEGWEFYMSPSKTVNIDKTLEAADAVLDEDTE